MQTVISKDGTKIAFDKSGNGTPLILVWGTLFTRRSYDAPKLPGLLDSHFKVFNYDRRGRGDSKPIRLDNVDREREIEDIEALIDDGGGSAFLFGHSSGAALSIYAAARLAAKVKKLSIYEPPFDDDANAQQVWMRYSSNVKNALAMGNSEDAVALTLAQIGMSQDQIDSMRQTPMYSEFVSNAASLAYDPAVVLGKDRRLPVDVLANIPMPVLVMVGGKSSPATHQMAGRLAEAIPNARLLELEGQSHEVEMKPLASALINYFG